MALIRQDQQTPSASISDVAPVVQHVVEVQQTVPSDVPRRSSWGEPLTNWEIQREKQIQVSGVIQAAVQAPVLQLFSTSYSEWWNLVQETAKNELKFIRENS
jgi:hypothetical protein